MVEATDYVKYRKQYLEVGNLLSTNKILYEQILQNQMEIKEILQKGWGY